MHDPRYIQVEENVYIDTKGGPSPQWRATVARLIVYVIGAFVLGSFSLLILPISRPEREHARRASCQSNLKQLALCIAQYEQNYDNHYPLVAVNATNYSTEPPYDVPFGWADAIYLYGGTASRNELYRCPSAGGNDETNPANPGFSNYWFNRNLAHMKDNAVFSPEHTFMLGDGTVDEDARSRLSSFPAAWKINQTSPVWRHLDGANYAFADGHVKWLAANQTVYGDTTYYHFSLK